MNIDPLELKPPTDDQVSALIDGNPPTRTSLRKSPPAYQTRLIGYHYKTKYDSIYSRRSQKIEPKYL